MGRFLARICGWLIAWTVLGAAPVAAEWRRAESPHFVLFADASESQLRERIQLLEDFNRLLSMLASVEERPAPKLHVYFVSGVDDLRTIRPVPDGIAGYYISTDEGIAAFVNSRTEGRGTEILFHEYTHHFMRQHMRGAYPLWYVEGFADYFATVRFTSRAIDIGNYSRGRIAALLDGQWLGMERVLSGGTEGLNQQNLSLFYAQSWLLVHYFFSTPERQAAMMRLLGASRRNRDPAEALQIATGLTPDQLGRELRRYISSRQISYRRAPRANFATSPQVTLAALPRSAGDMVLFEAALRVGLLDEQRQPYLQRIRAAAARYPDDPLAMRVLAHAELLYGDAAAADPLLDRLVAASPNDAQLLYLKGLRHLMAAESDDPPEGAAAEARAWFARARAADPTHFQTLVGYVRSLRGTPGFTSPDTLQLLVEASELAPQVGSLALNAARILISQGRHLEAIEMLAPLAANPHDPALADAARRLIAEAAVRTDRSGPPTPRDEEDPDAEGEKSAGE